MRLSDLEEANRLNARRDSAIKMHTAATEGTIECRIMCSGSEYRPLEMIGKPPVARAIADACNAIVAECDAALRGLGVAVDGDPCT